MRHSVESDLAYLRNLGSPPPKVPDGDWMVLEAAVRERALEALRDRAAGRPVKDSDRVSRPWTPRFYVRYTAWHALVHTWEIGDRKLEPA